MENLLLVFDEIDDVFSTIGLVWRPIVSFLMAVCLFVATGFVFYRFPLAAEILAIGLVSVGLFEMFRQRRLNQNEMRNANSSAISSPISSEESR